MAHEIETKVLDIDTKEIVQKLTVLGAKKTQETRLVVDWYRVKTWKESEDLWYLRIRTYSDGKNEVTWKAKSQVLGVARKHKEINFLIDEPEKLAELFLELDLVVYAHQEKDRLSYTLGDWTFDIDQYPKMPAYMEIEASSEESINEALKKFGLEKHRTSSEGERVLIEKTFGLDWNEMRF